MPRGRVVPQSVVEASSEAAKILAKAQADAAELVADAERRVSEIKRLAEAEARAEAAAKLAARALALAAREANADERGLDRTVALARLLAERLLGASLALEPEQIVALARQALAEARGARQLTVVAHPEDAHWLSQALPSLGVPADALRVVGDAGRLRGALRIETEIGVLDAELGPQLDRLAQRLRETLAHGE